MVGKITSYTVGRKGEDIAAEFLKVNKYKIISRNWRTKFSEIDIIAQKNNTIYFIEVKYRHSDMQGSGVDYIDNKKVNQLNKAANYWLSINDWDGDIEIIGISIDGYGSIEVFDIC